MQLIISSPSLISVHLDERILTRKLYSAFFLSDGRNAWHSTWVRRYLQDCLHTDFGTAREAAERHRTNGSVFYITEIPALVICTTNSMIFVVQINRHQPFEHFRPNGSQWRAGRRKSIHAALPVGNEASATMLALSAESMYWDIPPIEDEPVLAARFLGKEGELISFSDKNCVQFKSNSAGSHTKLDWNIEAGKHLSASIRRVLRTPARARQTDA